MVLFINKLVHDLNPKYLRYLFYLVTPNETIYESIEDAPNILEPATTWMLILITLEYLLLDEKKYAFNDTVTSINAGVLSLIMKISGKYLSAAAYPWVYDRLHIVDLPKNSASTWILCFFTQDFVYYLGHRAVHEAGVFWSFHQMHHSSEYYNLSTALRQGAIQDMFMMFFDLSQAIAIPPNIFIAHRFLNLLYQFWLHANAVPYLGPLEYFFNTPSSHRVHHGRNPYCIDRNYGGTLIIWDRLFGTYEPERKNETIAYGLVTPVASFNQLWCQIKAALWPPGYFPGVRTKPFFLWLSMKDNTDGIPEVEHPIVPYNPPLTAPLRYFLFVQWFILISYSLDFDAIRSTITWPEFIFRLIFLIAFLQIFGYYFDHSRISVIFDITRLTFSILAGLVMKDVWLIIYSFLSFIAISLLLLTGNIPIVNT